MDIMRLLLSAAAAMVISMPILVVLRRRKTVGGNTDRIIEEAQTAGRVVTAVQERAVRTRGEPMASSRLDRNRHWLCTYGYEVDGKRYKLRTQSEDKPPQEIRLFYPAGKPHKAVYRGKADHSPSNVFFSILPVLLWAVFYNFVFK